MRKAFRNLAVFVGAPCEDVIQSGGDVLTQKGSWSRKGVANPRVANVRDDCAPVGIADCRIVLVCNWQVKPRTNNQVGRAAQINLWMYVRRHAFRIGFQKHGFQRT